MGCGDRAGEVDRAYLLSISMPLTAARHGHDTIEPSLWGLLPNNQNRAGPLGEEVSGVGA